MELLALLIVKCFPCIGYAQPFLSFLSVARFAVITLRYGQPGRTGWYSASAKGRKAEELSFNV